MVDFAEARAFVYRAARVLEQRLFAVLFEDAPPSGVGAALAAYANDDGGLGHGLEPDARCPQSQPLFVAFGLEALAAVGAAPAELLRGCCDFLASVSDDRGAVPILVPGFEDYPHANHWDTADLRPSFQRVFGIAASLHELRFDHPWLDRVTPACLEELDFRPPTDAHLIHDALRLLEVLGEGHRARRVAAAIPDAEYVRRDPASTEYGLSPMQIAPNPSRARDLFDAGELDEHLGALAVEQQGDGGWPLTWEPPTEASRLEWRGARTVEALRILRDYGRLAA
jgi:hypothetical protein